MSYEEQAAQFKAERDKQIAQIPLDLPAIPQNPSKFYRSILDDHECEIVELDVTDLCRAISSGRYTSSEVAETYLKSAVAAHAGTNCLAWIDAVAVRERAKWLDEEMERNGPVGPLHGIPISIKDFVKVKGFTQSGGHVSSAGDVAEDDADIVAILREAGAMFMAKTTQPQSIMHLETSGFLGTTTNAFNSNLTSGGSSGGEGALVGCHGSPIGLTTDVGGSTRNPAANNGLWGFKPSTKRVPRDGMLGATAISRIAGAAGPVCHSLRDMDLFYRVVLNSPICQRDAKLVQMGWREVDDHGRGAGFNGWSGKGGKLRIGVMYDDGHVRPVQPIQRAMTSLVAKLEANDGVELVTYSATDFAEAWDLTHRLYYTDGGAKLRAALGSEPMRPLTEWIVSGTAALGREEVDIMVARRNELRQIHLDRFRAAGVDVILCPAGPAPAQPVGTTKYWSYTSMWNFLDWPAAVFPTGLVVEEADAAIANPEPLNEDEKHLYATYSVEQALGSPIGLQMVAPRWQDERLMSALKRVNVSLPLAT